MNKSLHPAAWYLFALAMVAAAVLARWLLSPYVEGRLPFVCLMLAMIAVSAFGGLGPGLLTLVLGTIATMWLFLPPGRTLMVEGLPHQIALATFVALGFAIAIVGECFKRARERSRAFEDLLGIDFKRTGEIYVRTPEGLRHLSSTPAGTSEESLAGANSTERALDRIVSEIIPGVAESVETPFWQVLANGEPVVNIEFRDKSRCEPGTLKKWVVTYLTPASTPPPNVKAS